MPVELLPECCSYHKVVALYQLSCVKTCVLVICKILSTHNARPTHWSTSSDFEKSPSP